MADVKTTTMRPLGDRVIIEPLDKEEVTAGGIFLPETAKEKPQEGKVIAAGPGRWDEEGKKRVAMDVKEGDIVLFNRYSGSEHKIGDKKVLIMSEKDILAIVS